VRHSWTPHSSLEHFILMIRYPRALGWSARANLVAMLAAITVAAGVTTFSGAAGADQADPGSIAGTVSITGAGDVTASSVELYDSAQTQLGITAPGADGNYSFGAVPPGSYTLHFDGPVGYQPEWWDNQQTQATATDVSVQPAVATVLGNAELDLQPLSPPPTITGVAMVGQLLTGSIGTWQPTPDSFDYQWSAGGAPITGATDSTYLLAAGDLGKAITLTVTGRRATADPITRTSAPAGPVLQGQFAGTAVTLTGTPQFQAVLSAVPGTWLPTPEFYGYQWLRDGLPIVGAEEAAYVPALADVGAQLSVRVTGRLSGYLDHSSDSSAVTIQPKPYDQSSTPAIVGQLIVGQRLTVSPGSWSPNGIFSYRWYRNATPLSGVVGQSYLLTTSDRGARISVAVTASQPGYATLTKHSAASAVVLGLLSASAPRLTGVARYGGTITVAPGVWGPGTVTKRYQWYVGTTAIPGASGISYRPAASVVGKYLHATVTGSRTGYASVTRASASVRIAAATFVSVPAPHISGAATVGSLLRVSTASTSPTSTLRFQWRLNGINVAQATGSSYRVRPVDVDRRITVVVTAVRPGYASAARGSAATAVVAGQAYPNCTALNAAYPHGVARSGVRYDVVNGVAKPFKGPPFFSNALYQLNTRSDRDHDGIECEQ
jgi:hypothetical protein